jgi:hypothetical protein
MFNKVFRKAYRIWEIVAEYIRAGDATDNNKARRMRLACWIAEARGTNSEYVIIIAFDLQQLLHDRASMLKYYLDARTCKICGRQSGTVKGTMFTLVFPCRFHSTNAHCSFRLSLSFTTEF